jgi:hypothetical protein
MQDAKKSLNDNIHASSFEGVETTVSTPVKREQGESNENLLRRLYSNALKSRRSG